MEGGTTFHFLDASPAEALDVAREAAGGRDVRIGGGPTVARDFLAAGLVDHVHLVQVPIVLGRGVRLWDGLEALEAGYERRGGLHAQRRHPPDLHPEGAGRGRGAEAPRSGRDYGVTSSPSGTHARSGRWCTLTVSPSTTRAPTNRYVPSRGPATG